MAILVESGRAAVATAIKNQPIHLAWGEGDPTWDQIPAPGKPEDINTTVLVKELGRRTVRPPQFCIPDANGTIQVSAGRFSLTANNTPSKYLYLNFMFELDDAPTATIRELGIFVGSQVSATPAKVDYFLPSEVSDPGQLLVLEYIDGLKRSTSIRQQFEFVIQF